jgi:hypothetical protein
VEEMERERALMRSFKEFVAEYTRPDHWIWSCYSIPRNQDLLTAKVEVSESRNTLGFVGGKKKSNSTFEASK